ncbi:MAG: hypothetical protein WC753_04095 [Candidatus Gracilibacteria bacterium]|jgi:uncharacterized membrane protein
MTLHPLIVHFPVALLTLYVMMEVLMQFMFKKNPTAHIIKRLLLYVGTIFIFFSLATGENAVFVTDFADGPSTLGLHAEFAEMCRNIFIIISIIYLAGEPILLKMQKFINFKLLQKLASLSALLQKYRITLFLALIGFFVLSAVGALGGAITRGTDHDPLAKIILQIGDKTGFNSEN